MNNPKICNNCKKEINENLGFCSSNDCIIKDYIKSRKIEKIMNVTINIGFIAVIAYTLILIF